MTRFIRLAARSLIETVTLAAKVVIVAGIIAGPLGGVSALVVATVVVAGYELI